MTAVPPPHAAAARPRRTLRGRPLSKLFSRHGEDPGRLHAVCGALAATHIALRVAHWLLHRTFGFDAGWTTPLCLLPHAGLALSAFRFRLPASRNPAAPMLWPVGRAHAAIFSARSLAVTLLGWAALRVRSPAARAALLGARGAAVLAACAAADVASSRLGAGSSDAAAKTTTTVRGMPWPPGWPRAARRLLSLWYAFSQLLASCMFTAYRLDTAFVVMTVIQLSAFLMTLCRKGLLSCAGWHVAYAAMLAAVLVQHVAAAPVVTVVAGGEAAPRACELRLLLPPMALFAVLRFRYHVSKYALWPAAMAAHAAAAARWGVLDCVVAP